MTYICENCKKEKENNFLLMIIRRDENALYGLCEECSQWFYKYMLGKKSNKKEIK